MCVCVYVYIFLLEYDLYTLHCKELKMSCFWWSFLCGPEIMPRRGGETYESERDVLYTPALNWEAGHTIKKSIWEKRQGWAQPKASGELREREGDFAGCQSAVLRVYLNVTSSLCGGWGGEEEELVAGANLITLRRLGPREGCSQPVCKDVEASGKKF